MLLMFNAGFLDIIKSWTCNVRNFNFVIEH